MNKFLISILALVILIGCGENTDEKMIDRHKLILNCDPSGFEIEEFTYCDSTIAYNPNPSFFCEYNFLGSNYLLLETRQYSKYMCELMNSVIFKNQNNEVLSLNVNSFASQFKTQWNEPCENEPGKEYLLCSQNEEATAILTNNTVGLEFRIILEISHRDNENSDNNMDQMLIYITLEDDFGEYYMPVLSFNIRGGPLCESSYPGCMYEEQLELNDEIFQDVFYSYPPGIVDKLKEIYYTKKLGIVAFRDESGILWTLSRFN